METLPNPQFSSTAPVPSASDPLPFDPSEIPDIVIAKPPVWESFMNGIVMLFLCGLALSLLLMAVNSAVPLKLLLKTGN